MKHWLPKVFRSSYSWLSVLVSSRGHPTEAHFLSEPYVDRASNRKRNRRVARRERREPCPVGPLVFRRGQAGWGLARCL